MGGPGLFDFSGGYPWAEFWKKYEIFWECHVFPLNFFEYLMQFFHWLKHFCNEQSIYEAQNKEKTKFFVFNKMCVPSSPRSSTIIPPSITFSFSNSIHIKPSLQQLVLVHHHTQNGIHPKWSNVFEITNFKICMLWLTL